MSPVSAKQFFAALDRAHECIRGCKVCGHDVVARFCNQSKKVLWAIEHAGLAMASRSRLE